MNNFTEVKGAGLGLRRSMMTAESSLPATANFFELAPENWIGVGGKFGEQLRNIAEEVPLVAHGLSLSIGGVAALDEQFLTQIKQFLDTFKISIYSEHLSYSDDGSHLYDLLPLPFTEEAVRHVATRVKQVQDRLERRIALENVSYYLCPDAHMSEIAFINAVLTEADCDLLLDVNNVYVNSINHGYDPHQFIQALPQERIRYLHIAGHYLEDDGLIIDTHGADVIDPVWELLKFTYQVKGQHPTLLERDFNIPSTAQLATELNQIHRLQHETRQDLRYARRNIA